MSQKDYRDPEFLAKFQSLAEQAISFISEMKNHPDPPRRSNRGGYLTIGIVSSDGMRIVYCNPVGEMPEGKRMSYMSNSLEKAQRLHASQKVSSFLTRKPEKGEWAGAIWCENVIISFSGLPELCDELVCLYVALQANIGGDHFAFNYDNHNPYVGNFVLLTNI